MQITFAQKESIHQIRGRILADSVGVDRVNIVNVTTQKATISDVSGTFSIPAKAGDILIFDHRLLHDATSPEVIKHILRTDIVFEAPSFGFDL